MAGLPSSTASPRFRRRLARCASTGENSRSKSSPVSPIATTRSSVASAAIAAQPASSTLAASCGWTPTAASSQGNRSTRAIAPAHEAGSQPGTRIRSTPARRAPPSTSSTSWSKRSAWRWQWLSTSRGGAGPSPRRQKVSSWPATRGPAGADTSPTGSTSSRGKSGSGAVTRPASGQWAPQRSSSSRSGPPLPSAAYG